MSKGMDAKKTEKKKSEKSLKEKRAEKKQKKATRPEKIRNREETHRRSSLFFLHTRACSGRRTNNGHRTAQSG